MLEITKVICPASKYALKCPNVMKPEGIAVHNTYNDASAMAEVSYMLGNNRECSFHFAVDDYRAVNGIDLNRNAWHAGDGNGKGNRKMIAVEICYSKSGGERFIKAVNNAAELIAELLREYGWNTSKVYKHQDFSGKHCPHRILDEYGWENFLNLIREQLGEEKKPVCIPASAPINVQDIKVNAVYRVRTGGKWLPEVLNFNDFGGITGRAITDIAIGVSKGTIKYRVHIKGGKWLPYVTGFNIGDGKNGYAGNGKAIDAVEAYYFTPGDIRPYKAASYRVSPKGGNYYPVQTDNLIGRGMDGYAGSFGKEIDRFQIEIK